MGKSTVAKIIGWIRGGKKGPIRDHLAKKLSIAFTLVLFALLLTSAESKGGFSDGQKRGRRRHSVLSSSIVRAQVPASADHFNQLNATDTACCYEPPAQFKEAHRWVTPLRRLFSPRPLLPTSAMGVRDRGTRKMGVMGQADITQTSCLLLPCWFLSTIPPHPHLYKGYTSTSDMKCG